MMFAGGRGKDSTWEVELVALGADYGGRGVLCDFHTLVWALS
jgi:hypothetical protein